MFDERRIIPIVADGARVYWMEVRRSAFNGVVNENTPSTQLVRCARGAGDEAHGEHAGDQAACIATRCRAALIER